MEVVKLPKKFRMVCYEIMDGKEEALDTLEAFADKYPHQIAAVKAEVSYFNLDYEKAHSTGHPSALGRSMNTVFESPEYAREELVAELGSLFLSADLVIQSADYEGDFYENHVAYLQSWMHALADGSSYLFKAAAKADKAAGFIMGRYTDTLSRQ